MSEPFIAEVKIFGGNFAPRGWAFCDGQLLPIAQNTALFSLIGTTYGGDGRTTTALPDLRGRAAMHPSRGTGLTQHTLGQRGGVAEISLSEAQIPAHSHVVNATSAAADSGSPAGNRLAMTTENHYGPANDLENLSGATVTPVGGGEAHQNMQPYLVVNFIIALIGLFPSRS